MIRHLFLRRKENLFSAHEIYLISGAISAMAFRLETVVDTSGGANHDVVVMRWQEREVFRYDRTSQTFCMTGLSGQPEPVYHFRWWSPGDWAMRAHLKGSIRFYEANIQRVRMQDYRAMFGKKMEEVIADLATVMSLAEQEAREVARLDRASGGRRLHPDVQRMVQTDPDVDDIDPTAGEEV